MSGAPVTAAPAIAAHAPELAALFERAGVACHCRYWHFEGDANAWLARCAHEPDRNRTEMTDALRDGREDGAGVVALVESRVVGWLKLAAATRVPKLYAQRIYRRLPCFDGPREGVLAVGCILVDPERRRTGVASALVRGAVDAARERGATAIEAFPRRADPARDDELWTGPYSVFERAGFRVVSAFAPYPVLRIDL